MCVILSYGKYFIPDKIPLAPHLAPLYGTIEYLHEGKQHIYDVKKLSWLIYYAMKGGYDSVQAPPLTFHPFVVFTVQVFCIPSFVIFWCIWVFLLFIAISDIFNRLYKIAGLTGLSIFAFFLFFASPLNKIIWWGESTFFAFYFLLLYLLTQNLIIRGLSLAFAFLLEPFAGYMLLPILILRKQWKLLTVFCISYGLFNIFPCILFGPEIIKEYYFFFFNYIEKMSAHILSNFSLFSLLFKIFKTLVSFAFLLNIIRLLIFIFFLLIFRKNIRVLSSFIDVFFILLGILTGNILFPYHAIFLLLLPYLFFISAPKRTYLLIPLFFFYHSIPSGIIYPVSFLWIISFQFISALILIGIYIKTL